MAAAAALWSSPAVAFDAAQSECVAAAMPDDEEVRLAEAMISSDLPDEARDRLQTRFKAFVDGCVQTTAVPGSAAEAYFSFQLAKVASEALARLLDASGIPVEVLDEVMDLGPGRSNPAIEQVSEEQVVRIIVALGARGVDTDAIGTGRWEQVGGYIAARSLMFRALSELS